MKRRSSLSIQRMTLAAILTALIAIMSFTPIGYLRIAGVLSITFLPIPVAIGAVLLGPLWGMFFGAVFGLTSFIQCFGMDVFGTALCVINPVFTFLMCMIPRMLTGLLPALLYKALSKVDKKKYLAVSASTLSAALVNTVFFTLLFILFFRNADLSAVEGVATNYANLSIMDIILGLVTVNMVIEAVACGVFGTAISKTVTRFIPDFNHK